MTATRIGFGGCVHAYLHLHVNLHLHLRLQREPRPVWWCRIWRRLAA